MPPSRLLTVPSKEDIEGILGYAFKDQDLLIKAMQAASNGVYWVGSQKVSYGNKTVAMIGDI